METRARGARIDDPRWAELKRLSGGQPSAFLSRAIDIAREAEAHANGRPVWDYVSEAIAVRSALPHDAPVVQVVNPSSMSLLERARLYPTETRGAMAVAYVHARGDRKRAAESMRATPQQWSRALSLLPGMREALAKIMRAA